MGSGSYCGLYKVPEEGRDFKSGSQPLPDSNYTPISSTSTLYLPIMRSIDRVSAALTPLSCRQRDSESGSPPSKLSKVDSNKINMKITTILLGLFATMALAAPQQPQASEILVSDAEPSTTPDEGIDIELRGWCCTGCKPAGGVMSCKKCTRCVIA